MRYSASSCLSLLLLLATVALTACSPSASSLSDEEREPHFQAGKSRVSALDYKGAIQSFEKALEANPADQESRYALGQVLLAMGNVDEGRVELDKYESIRRQVDTANDNYKTALSYITARQFSDAEKLLRDAVRLAPKYAPALHSLGTLLLDRGNAKEAADVLKRAVETNPLNDASWFSLGAAYFKLGKSPDALQAVRHAIALNDEDDEYRRLLKEIQAKLGDKN